MMEPSEVLLLLLLLLQHTEPFVLVYLGKRNAFGFHKKMRNFTNCRWGYFYGAASFQNKEKRHEFTGPKLLDPILDPNEPYLS